MCFCVACSIGLPNCSEETRLGKFAKKMSDSPLMASSIDFLIMITTFVIGIISLSSPGTLLSSGGAWVFLTVGIFFSLSWLLNIGCFFGCKKLNN